MPVSQKSCVCARCGPVLGQKEGVNHVLHAILSIFTCTLWMWVWGFLFLVNLATSYRCQRCGMTV